MLLLVGAGMLGSFFPGQLSRLAYGLGGTAAALVATYLFLRLQQSSFAYAGLNWLTGSFRRFIIGLIIGGVTLAIMLTTLYILTEIQWKPNHLIFSSEIIIGYVAILPLAFMEEVAFRAYPFLLLQKRYGIWIAQIVTAVAFALYHLPGGNSLVGVLLGPGIWGLVFGLSAAWSRGIAVPFGIHVALNAGQMIMGMKGNDLAVWKLDMHEHTRDINLYSIDTIGLGMQLAILGIAIITTEMFRRKITNTPQSAGL